MHLHFIVFGCFYGHLKNGSTSVSYVLLTHTTASTRTSLTLPTLTLGMQPADIFSPRGFSERHNEESFLTGPHSLHTASWCEGQPAGSTHLLQSPLSAPPTYESVLGNEGPKVFAFCLVLLFFFYLSPQSETSPCSNCHRPQYVLKINCISLSQRDPWTAPEHSSLSILSGSMRCSLLVAHLTASIHL